MIPATLHVHSVICNAGSSGHWFCFFASSSKLEASIIRPGFVLAQREKVRFELPDFRQCEIRTRCARTVSAIIWFTQREERRISVPGEVRTEFDRRTFLDALLGVGFVSTAIAMAYPVARYLNPPASVEPATASVVVGKAIAIKPNSGALFKFGNRPGIIIRTAEGEIRAFSAVCTHLDCTVQFKADTSQLWCACHNGLYDLGGNVVSGPPPRGLERFVVNLRGEPGDEEVVVSRA